MRTNLLIRTISARECKSMKCLLNLCWLFFVYVLSASYLGKVHTRMCPFLHTYKHPRYKFLTTDLCDMRTRLAKLMSMRILLTSTTHWPAIGQHPRIKCSTWNSTATYRFFCILCICLFLCICEYELRHT